MKRKVETRELSPELWPEFEKLFGANGACGGCWCMSWRIAKGEKWEDVKGPTAKRRMKKLILDGKALGVMAFVDGEPVGWCSFGPRADYLKLDRAPSLRCDDAAEVWSLPCFFVRNGYRGQGVATAMIEAALRSIKGRGGKIAEGYPAKPPKDGKPIPHAFAWTGTVRLFEAAGFTVAGNRDGGKVRMRKALRR